MRIFLSETDLRCDRALYTHLLTDILDEDSACHLELVSSGGDEDTFLYLKYNADDDFRRAWGEDYPDDLLPDQADPPYDRDRFLPAADCNPPGDLAEGEG